MKWGIIADDNTGASDAAGMLTSQGIRSVLLFNNTIKANRACLNIWDAVKEEGFDAVILGTQIRSVDPEEAYKKTAHAVRTLRDNGIEHIQLKYCSTFDSTKNGNIGQSLDAASDALKTDTTIVCPALPVNKRTVYMGHLFVGNKILSESPLRYHPINPMVDANIVRWLSYQTKRKVGLVELSTVRKGAAAIQDKIDSLRNDGYQYMVTDTCQENDLLAIADATRNSPLISGGSGITWALPPIHFPQCQTHLTFTDKINALNGATLAVSGSMSPATRTQNMYAIKNGFEGIVLDIPAIIKGTYDTETIIAQAASILASGTSLLVYSITNNTETVCDIQALGAAFGMNEIETGKKITETLGDITRRLVEKGIVAKLIVSGGETSGEICRSLDVEALEVGLPIEPGVPYCFPFPFTNPLMIVLKSGNFGTETFYSKVANM